VNDRAVHRIWRISVGTTEDGRFRGVFNGLLSLRAAGALAAIFQPAPSITAIAKALFKGRKNQSHKKESGETEEKNRNRSTQKSPIKRGLQAYICR
jgi:hypothetical protein